MSKSIKSKSYSGGALAEAINTRITRRSFLKWSAAIGATASAAGLITQSRITKARAEFGEAAPNSISTVTKWVPTICLTCHSWCGLAVGLDSDGVMRKIEGSGGQTKPCASKGWTATHPEDYHYVISGGVGGEHMGLDGLVDLTMATGYLPTPPHNRGRICAKGNTGGIEHTYDPDRVKYPLLRQGDRGSGK